MELRLSTIGSGTISADAERFVKMVHDGIGCAVIELIAESCLILKRIGGFSNRQLAETFEAWSGGEDLQSYLVKITAEIFKKKDDKEDGDLIDLIKDAADLKGVGDWTAQAHEFKVAVPTINAAMDAHILSESDPERESGKHFPVELDEQDPVPPPEKLRSIVRHALKLSVICTYFQGFRLIEEANKEKKWGIDLSDVARTWQGDCVIQSVLLKRFERALGTDVALAKAAKEALLERFRGDRQLDWRRAVTYASSRGIPVPAMSASLNYYDSLRLENI